jgi:Ca2+-binding EF-hand superfamily protein
LSEKLVITLLRKDRKRTGFVTDYDIQDSLKSVGMSLKNKQIGQLTYALHQNVYGSFSYPELI